MRVGKRWADVQISTNTRKERLENFIFIKQPTGSRKILDEETEDNLIIMKMVNTVQSAKSE
jgi:hypothetical protein